MRRLLLMLALVGCDTGQDSMPELEAADFIDEDGVSDCLEPGRWLDCVELCEDAGMACENSWAYPNEECAVKDIPADWEGPKRESCDADGAASFQCQCSG